MNTLTLTLNLTQHQATPSQIAAGVQDLPPDQQAQLKKILDIRVGGPDGYASLSPDGRKALLMSRAHTILMFFIRPRVAQLTRDRFSFIQDMESPANWSDVEALNARRLPVLRVMVGGFHPLMKVLIPALREEGCEPVVALSDRTVQEETQPDGTVKKTAIFEHLGFDPA